MASYLDNHLRKYLKGENIGTHQYGSGMDRISFNYPPKGQTGEYIPQRFRSLIKSAKNSQLHRGGDHNDNNVLEKDNPPAGI
ncbi:hypothetical protein C922_03605 [Plasmodium inui San Antonio 1]|uniref:Uncharacterized protein n=1 Tax=Plasmodium inui San Antonio 1 TaxID=1237626 RepID=W7AKL4_9APIC|nr:hypothetical protein C922_03605 [Plasmodium inui San Antonio 1]EUD65881.1 hypothetical protein C922_03605 [Plasmodium inui San Antonio 1]